MQVNEDIQSQRHSSPNPLVERLCKQRQGSDGASQWGHPPTFFPFILAAFILAAAQAVCALAP